jgi:hypothetical protein
MSITFDTVLKYAEIDPASVHLVRHQDIRAKSNRTP